MKTIYLVPEPGVQGFKTGHTDHSIDIPFRISGPARLSYPDTTFQIPCGCRTYTDPGVGGIILVPRSKSSLLWPKDQLERHTIHAPSYLLVNGEVASGFPPEITLYQKNDLRLANTIGYIDWSYRGEWIARVQTQGRVMVEPGIAYLQAVPLNTEYSFTVVDSIKDVPPELLETSRGADGFGSTDVQHSTPPSSS